MFVLWECFFLCMIDVILAQTLFFLVKLVFICCTIFYPSFTNGHVCSAVQCALLCRQYNVFSYQCDKWYRFLKPECFSSFLNLLSPEVYVSTGTVVTSAAVSRRICSVYCIWSSSDLFLLCIFCPKKNLVLSELFL